jgi:hypothetical protein
VARKTVDFDKTGVGKLPDDKSIVYKILTKGGKNNYTGGRQLEEHLAGGKDYVPGVWVQIEQVDSIREARKKEARIIARTKPRHNKQGK